MQHPPASLCKGTEATGLMDISPHLTGLPCTRHRFRLCSGKAHLPSVSVQGHESCLKHTPWNHPNISNAAWVCPESLAEFIISVPKSRLLNQHQSLLPTPYRVREKCRGKLGSYCIVFDDMDAILNKTFLCVSSPVQILNPKALILLHPIMGVSQPAQLLQGHAPSLILT